MCMYDFLSFRKRRGEMILGDEVYPEYCVRGKNISFLFHLRLVCEREKKSEDFV